MQLVQTIQTKKMFMQQRSSYGSGKPSSASGGLPPLDKNNPKARTLWMGDLDDTMDDNFVKSLFGNDVRSSIVSVKIIKDRNTGKSAGYGFVEFTTIDMAKAVLDNYAGKPIPSFPNRVYRLNSASYGGGSGQGSMGRPGGKDLVSIFVGDLAPDVNDYLLEQAFRNKYSSVRNARVVMDPRTGISKGFGFVKFTDEDEMMRAMTEMQGHYISSRPIKISHATNNFKAQGGMGSMSGSGLSSSLFNALPTFASQPVASDESMPTTIITTEPQEQENTTVYVGNLSPTTDEKILREFFQGYGPITSVKIPTNSNCGFINFTRTEHAERAIIEMNGIEIQGNRVRVSWGRAQHKKHPNQLSEDSLGFQLKNAATTAFDYQQRQHKSILEKKEKEEEEKKRLEMSVTFTKPFDISADNQRFLDENNLMDTSFF